MPQAKKVYPNGTIYKNENAFQSAVVKTFRKNGWLVYFSPRVSFSKWGGVGRGGFPDLIAYRNKLFNEMVAIELKMPKGRVQEDQWGWLNAFEERLPTYVFFPEDQRDIDRLAIHGWLEGGRTKREGERDAKPESQADKVRRLGSRWSSDRDNP